MYQGILKPDIFLRLPISLQSQIFDTHDFTFDVSSPLSLSGQLLDNPLPIIMAYFCYSRVLIVVRGTSDYHRRVSEVHS